MLGKDENVRFMNLALYQGQPIKKGITTIVCVILPFLLAPLLKILLILQAMATSDNPLLNDKDMRDPTLFCTAWKRPRFYMFTRTDPE